MLKLASDGQVWSLADAREELAKHFQLTEEEIEELLPSGRQARFANRVAWAKVYLERGGLLSSPKRAHFQITDRGREVLKSPPEEVSISSSVSIRSFRSSVAAHLKIARMSQTTKNPIRLRRL